MQRLPGDRSWTVLRSAKRELWQATKENQSKTIDHLLRWGQEEIEKNPRRTQLACHRTAHIGHGQHVHWNPTVSKHEALTMDTSSMVRSTNSTLVFLIRVGSLASWFASTWRAMSMADPLASPVAVVKRAKVFRHHHRQLCSLSSVRITTDLPGDFRQAPWKIHCGRTEQERRLLLALPWWYKAIALPIDATIQMNSHRASAAAPRPKGAENEPTRWRKETHDWTRTVTASTSTSTEASSHFNVPLTWSWRKVWPTGYSYKQVTVERRWDGAEPSIFRDYKFDDNDARDDVWDQEVVNSIWRRGSIDRGSAFPDLLFFLVYAYLVEWENFENRPRPKFFSARSQGSPPDRDSVLEKHFDGDFTPDQEKKITFKRWSPGY